MFAKKSVITGFAVAASLVAFGAGTTATAADYLIENGGIQEFLSGEPGDPANGRKIAVTKNKGNCLACHAMPIPDHQFHGETGPDLGGVGSRMTEGEIRLRMVDSKKVNPDTMMPAFYRTDGFNRVLKKFQGKTILSAKEVDDVVAYLMTLKDE